MKTLTIEQIWMRMRLQGPLSVPLSRGDAPAESREFPDEPAAHVALAQLLRILRAVRTHQLRLCKKLQLREEALGRLSGVLTELDRQRIHLCQLYSIGWIPMCIASRHGEPLVKGQHYHLLVFSDYKMDICGHTQPLLSNFYSHCWKPWKNKFLFAANFEYFDSTPVRPLVSR